MHVRLGDGDVDDVYVYVSGVEAGAGAQIKVHVVAGTAANSGDLMCDIEALVQQQAAPPPRYVASFMSPSWAARCLI